VCPLRNAKSNGVTIAVTIERKNLLAGKGNTRLNGLKPSTSQVRFKVASKANFPKGSKNQITSASQDQVRAAMTSGQATGHFNRDSPDELGSGANCSDFLDCLEVGTLAPWCRQTHSRSRCAGAGLWRWHEQITRTTDDRRQRLEIASIGQLVDNENSVIAAPDRMANHRRADESGTPGDEDATRHWRAERNETETRNL
jgi:hypothetical protein